MGKNNEILLSTIEVEEPNKMMVGIAIATFGLLMLIAGLLLGVWLK